MKTYHAPQLGEFGTVAELTGVSGSSSAQDVFVNYTSQSVFGFGPGTTTGTGSIMGCAEVIGRRGTTRDRCNVDGAM